MENIKSGVVITADGSQFVFENAEVLPDLAELFIGSLETDEIRYVRLQNIPVLGKPDEVDEVIIPCNHISVMRIRRSKE